MEILLRNNHQSLFIFKKNLFGPLEPEIEN